LIGRGTFGKVYLVKNKTTGTIHAMKSIRKDIVLQNDSLESLMVEKLILLQVRHPFIIAMDAVFANEERIYFVMPFIQGGELFKHLSEARRFSEDRVRFYATQIALALGYLHKSNIYYRDLKPENILLDRNGYILLADFGLAKIKNPETGEDPNSFCGTPEYLSPEMIDGTGHDHTLDWWALGVLIYEMIIGIPPFYHENQHQMYQRIQQGSLKWPDPVRHGISISEEAKDLIIRLLEKKRKQRLGQEGDVEEVLSHPFFAGKIDTEALMAKKIQPEFIPTIDGSGINNFDQEITNEKPEFSIVPAEAKAKIQQDQNVFEEFGFSSNAQ
jgi:serum/glucocorticoid-regulated kinase 2